jgi:HEPN domain-containing protein
VDRGEFQQLSKIRLKEARALLKLGHYDGAYYLAGYAVEFALKACIAKGTRRYEFPDKGKAVSSYTHVLRDLVGVAKLGDALQERERSDPDFRANWVVVRSWSEGSRYERHTMESAKELIEAVGETRHGVISWIKLHW